MTDTTDPIANRGAQIDAAFAIYSTELEKAQTEYHGRVGQAAEDLAATERTLFAEYRQRVMDIAGIEAGRAHGEQGDDNPNA